MYANIFIKCQYILLIHLDLQGLDAPGQSINAAGYVVDHDHFSRVEGQLVEAKKEGKLGGPRKSPKIPLSYQSNMSK